MNEAETRAELPRLFGGPDDAAFLEYLNENCYDLHYAPAPPCIHRAPETHPGQPCACRWRTGYAASNGLPFGTTANQNQMCQPIPATFSLTIDFAPQGAPEGV